MQTNHWKHLAFGLSLGSLAFAASAWAASPVTITNPGFEDPAVATDGGFNTSATGWTNVNSANEIGVLNPDTATFTAEAPEGTNVGYVFGGVVDAGLAQVLTATLQADATYNLSVKVGNSVTYAYDGYRVQLLAGGTVLAEDHNTLSPAPDSFVTATVNYSYNAGLHAGLVGQPLEIRLLGKGLSGGAEGETEFDDVQLTVALANPVADPGGPYLVAIPDGSLSLDGSGSLPAEGQTITTYEWDLDNDGSFDDATGVTPAAIDYATLTAAPPAGFGMVEGANTIKLRVTDDSSPAPKAATAETTVTLAEPFTTMTASSNWNGGTWDNGQPTIGLDAVIAAGVTATATNAVTPWSGKLTLEAGSTLAITSTVNPNPADMVFDGATRFVLKDGSKIIDNFKTATFAQNFVITGTAGMDSTANAGNNHNRTFTGTISGGTWVTDGRNHQGYTYNSANTFAGYEVRSTESQRHGVAFNAAGAAGLGNVTVTTGGGAQSAVLILGANDVFATNCVLTLNGKGWATSTGGFGPYAAGPWVGTNMRIYMNTYNATVSELWIDGVQWAAGTYTGTSGDWIGGTGVLTVLNGPADSDPPTLAPADIVDNVSGGPVFETDSVTYTVTFSEPLDPASVEPADFGNGGTAPATIQSASVVGKVVTVVASPGGPGTLILQVVAGAVMSDFAGNNLDTTNAIADDTTITVDADPPPTLTSIEDNMAGGPVFVDQGFTYLVTFNEAMDPATVDAGDFENAAGPAVTVTNVIATGNPAVFAVDVTPGGTGAITLQIKAGAAITDDYGTALDTTSPLPDDTTITVNAGSVPPRGVITMDGAVSTSANSGTVSVTLDASGSDKLVVIVTGENGNPGSLAGNCTGVTYDGVPLTQAVDRNPIGSTPVDQTYNDIWYLDLDGVTTVSGLISASVNSRGSVTAIALSGTAPGVGSTAISPQATKSVVLSTTFANSVVIASHGMGGDGNSANVTAVDAVLPLDETSATAQASGAPFPWDGHVTAYALVPTAGTAAYEFTGGNLVGSHTIAAEFLAAEAGTGTPYATWAATNAPTGNPEDDFDGDGVSNAVEFVLGGGKDTNDLAKLPVAATTPGGDMTFTFVRDQDSIDTSVEVTIEVSPDLTDWSTNYAVPDADTGGVVNPGVTVVSGTGIDTVTLTVPRDSAKKFARLKVALTL